MKISPLWYPTIDVDSDSQEFRDVIAWLVAHGAPKPELEEGGSYGAAFGAMRGPDQFLFVRDGKTLRLDAALVFASPSLGLNELQREFGFGDTRFFMPYSRPVVLPPTPPPPPPADVFTKVGDEFAPGRREALDNAPAGHKTQFMGAKWVKQVRRTPFGGTSQWYERQ
jgi:hypothetical protein